MARPIAQNHEQQRAAIRTHAIAAFARTGYASASMSDLANACGVSKATLYHYFENKEALLLECLDQYVHRLSALTHTAASARSTDPVQAGEQLKVLIGALVKEYADSHNYHVSLLHDVNFLSDDQASDLRVRQRAIVGDIADMIDSAFPGRLEPAKRIATTMALLGTINFSFAWFNANGPLSHEAFAQIVIDLWFHGLAE
jgi:AcrR family transcriptional regulator